MACRLDFMMNCGGCTCHVSPPCQHCVDDHENYQELPECPECWSTDLDEKYRVGLNQGVYGEDIDITSIICNKCEHEWSK